MQNIFWEQHDIIEINRHINQIKIDFKSELTDNTYDKNFLMYQMM